MKLDKKKEKWTKITASGQKSASKEKSFRKGEIQKIISEIGLFFQVSRVVQDSCHVTRLESSSVPYLYYNHKFGNITFEH